MDGGVPATPGHKGATGTKMGAVVDADELLAAQRELRGSLLDSRGAVAWTPARDLAAQLLLYLDDSTRCWQLSVDWIQRNFAVDRADAGLATPAQPLYHPAWVEARSAELDVPSLRGVEVNNRAGAAHLLWTSPKPLVFAEVAQDRRFGTRTREALIATRTIAKVAIAVRYRELCLGLLCADRTVGTFPWSSDLMDRFEMIGREVLPPILAASLRFDAAAQAPHDDGADLADLTPAELKVARLAAEGLPYKQIARVLNRSFSTVDHQLRAIRRKTGASNHAQLASRLARLPLGRTGHRESSR